MKILALEQCVGVCCYLCCPRFDPTCRRRRFPFLCRWKHRMLHARNGALNPACQSWSFETVCSFGSIIPLPVIDQTAQSKSSRWLDKIEMKPVYGVNKYRM